MSDIVSPPSSPIDFKKKSHAISSDESSCDSNDFPPPTKKFKKNMFIMDEAEEEGVSESSGDSSLEDSVHESDLDFINDDETAASGTLPLSS